ncbi:MAG: outer membrane lipoprotein carrier protein LolA [Endomicrobium sp.]|jgi:outer membrane lipoprotein carrier protein|nr:outer membrane lipoprotein carrier protein LolA [Endomicrobium sp.]
MKKLYQKIKDSIFICAACLSFLASIAFTQENAANAQDDFAKFTKVKTIYSSFKIEKHIAIAEQPLISKGIFYFKSPDNLRWEYSFPFRYGFVIKGAKIISWQDEDGRREIKDISSRTVMSAMIKQLYVFIAMDKEKISKVYKIKKSGIGIILYPKDDSKDQEISDIAIEFAKNSAAIERVIISEKSGGKTVITFGGTKIDGELPENAFEI